jgi:hypothetical protein
MVHLKGNDAKTRVRAFVLVTGSSISHWKAME